MSSLRKLTSLFLLILTILAAANPLLNEARWNGPVAVRAASLPSPVIIGWGGSRLDESQVYDLSIPSEVFPGQQASNQELQVKKLQIMGFNAIRVSFESACSFPQEMGPYNSGWLDKAVQIAKHYNFYIIVDYHGYNDLQSSLSRQCWLSFWSPVVQQFVSAYDRIIWEPLNEPTGIGDDVALLSSSYQSWIYQARGFDDTHWIIAQNICSFGCGLSNQADGYPTVTDPANRIFISLHSYMYYPSYERSWNNATAEAVAQDYYQAVFEGITRTGWPALNTEGGTDPLLVTCHGDTPLPSTDCAPDQILGGSAGYSTTTFHFIQELTNLYDRATPKIGWTWWPAGCWTDTPNSSTPPDCGSLAANGWGSKLKYQPVILTLQVLFSWTPLQPAAGETFSFSAVAGGGSPPYSLAWDFGDGVGASGENASHSYSQAGTYAVKVTVTDSGGENAIAQGAVTVGNPAMANNPPVISVPGSQVVDEGSFLTFTVAAADNDTPPQTVALSITATVAGSSFDGQTGLFSWAPTESQGPGNYDVNFTADDGNGGVLTSTVKIHVNEVNLPPVVLLPGPKTAEAGQTLSFTVDVDDPDIPANLVTLTANGLVDGMTFDASTGSFSFTPKPSQDGQEFRVTFTASDDGTPQKSASQAQVITVAQSSLGGECLLCTFSANSVWPLALGGGVGLVLTVSIVALRRRRRNGQNAMRTARALSFSPES